MKKNLLYIGNKLLSPKNNATSIDTLGLLLEIEGYKMSYASTKVNKVARLLDMIFTTIRLRKKVDYVLIDVYSTNNFWYALIISQLCRFLNLKYIPKLHGGNLPNRFKNNPKLCSLIFDNAHYNIAPSNFLLFSSLESGLKGVYYIPNTIELKNYTFKSRKNIEPKLLWVRSFDKIYNPIMAVKVFIEIKKTYPNATLCMVGPDKDGTLQKTQDFANQQNVEVTFTGKLSKPDWIKLSQDYDIFINTTHFDNTPVSVIEAMALGLAVVSTNVGGIPFLLENNDTALLVNDNDAKEMENSIKTLIENDETSQKIIKNARELSETFDWEEVKRLWSNILD